MNKAVLYKLFIVILAVVFVAEILFLLWACGRHLDFTDEAFYVLSSLYPEQFTTRFSDFGYLNAAIMSITGRNLHLLRAVGLFILFVSSFGTVYQSLLYTEKQIQISFDRKERYVWILTGMIASVGYYFWGMTTPSYNFYSLVGILTALTGFLQLLNNKKYIYAVFLLSFGILVLYIGKPTSALFFVFCITIWTIIAHFLKLLETRELIKPLLGSAVLFFILFLIYILAIYGSFNAYLKHIQHTQQLLSTVGYSPELIRKNIISSVLSELEKFYFLTPYSLTIIIFSLFYKKQHFMSFKTEKLYFYLIALLIVFGGFFSHKGVSWKWAWGYMAILYAAIAYFIFYLIHVRQSIKQIFIFLFLFISASISYVFGTNNYFSIALSGAYLIIAIGLMYLSVWIYHAKQNFIAIFVSISLIVLFSLSTLGQFFMHPYRSEVKLYQHKDKLNILGGIYVDKHHSNYAKQLQDIQKKHPEIEKFEYLIDISGKSGVNLILNKKYLGQSWVVLEKTDTYYHFANSILKSVPLSEIKKSILLTNEVLPIEKILKDIPLSFPENYTCVGKVYSMPEKEYHLLWIPK